MEERHEGIQKAFSLLRILFIYLYLVILLALNASRLPFFDAGNTTPYFLLMGIYFWSVSRPAMLPAYLVFVFGLLLDIVAGQPIGINALAFVFIAFILYGQRRFLKAQSWPVLWAGYGIAALAVAMLHMLVFLLMNWSWPGLSNVFMTVLTSVLAYPVMILPMVTVNKFLR